MSEKLFWKNSYETEFNAKIIEINNEGIILDKTHFYPESGNQAIDLGFLIFGDLKFKIDKVSKVGEHILHHISSSFENKLKIGDIVNGKIDWEYRYGIMKAHTSQHVFSAVVKDKFKIDTIRASLGFEEVFIQISKKIDYNQLKKILNEVNKICTFHNLKVYANILSQQEAKKKSETLRSKIPDEPNVRLMEIEGLDLVGCGGTHVRNTIEIGKIFIYEFKKGKEIRYCIGNKALLMDTNFNIDLINLANKLNSPLEKTKDLIEKRLEFLDHIQEEQKDLSTRYLELITNLPFKIINGISLFYIEFNINIKILNRMMDLFPNDSIIVLKFENNKIRILSLNERVDSKKILQKLIEQHGGKGGGNPKSSQGVLNKMPDDVIFEIETLLKTLNL